MRQPAAQFIVIKNYILKQLFYLHLFLLFFLPVANAQLIKRINGSTISSDALSKKINTLMDSANVSGMAVVVFNKNIPVFNKVFGLANVPKNDSLQPNSMLYAASFSKLVFTYVVLQLVQEKKLDLDKPLINYLRGSLVEYRIPGYKRGYQDLKNDERYKLFTARMCLAHTTGLPNWRWFEANKKLKIKFDPGTRYSYSGEGFYLLQFVIEQITGIDYETMVQQRVFIPLQMHNTSQVWQPFFDDKICYGHNNQGEPYELMKWKESSGAGSMTTTPADYTRFYTALIQGRGLSKASFKAMLTPQIRIRSLQQFGPDALVDSNTNDNIQLSYGLGVGLMQTLYGKAFFKEGHDEGWGHYSVCFVDMDIAIFIFTNNDNGESIFKELLSYAIGDEFTPWQWENYIPYNKK